MVHICQSLKEYQDTIKNNEVVVVDYFATWCGPCVAIAPRFEQLSTTYPHARFLKVDVDQQPEISSLAGVRAMPTFHVFVNGQRKEEIVGADARKLEEAIRNTRSHKTYDFSTMTVEDLKTQGNKAFSSGQFDEAIKLFTEAIQKDPANHVLYSNRSAAYTSLKQYEKALTDAEKTVQIKPDWAKGYSRKGAALHGLNKLEEAATAYEEGLKLDPNNALLQKGLEDVEMAKMSNPATNPIAKLFGPDVWTKIATNPKLSHYLNEPDIVEKIKAIQANPAMVNMHLNDQRMMQLMVGLMGIDAQVHTGDDTPMEDAPSTEPHREAPAPKKPAEEPPKEPEQPATEEERKRQLSDAEKEKGNALYKQRKFEDAISHYEKAWELDETNIAVLTNKAAVLFEMGKYEDCIKDCEKAAEVGRTIFANFKLIARAYGRMGNAYAKLEDLDNAIKYLNKSLAEHRTPDVLEKLRELEKLKKKRDEEAYRNPALSDEARERGNALFKSGAFSDAVKEYTDAIKRNDQDARNYSNRAACFMKLMAFPEADKDCDTAIALDPKFVKAYIRKAAIQFAKRDFMKCIEICQEAKSHDTEGKHTAEIDAQMMKAYAGLNEVQRGNTEETAKRAMNNPEVREIMGDPVMQQILQQMQTDPAAIQTHMQNPMVAGKLRTLINAGIVRMG